MFALKKAWIDKIIQHKRGLVNQVQSRKQNYK